MEIFRKFLKRNVLKNELKTAIEELGNESQGTPEYEEKLCMIERISKTISAVQGNKKKCTTMSVDPNTILVIAGSIVEILIITHSEGVRSITTKALGRIIRPKI